MTRLLPKPNSTTAAKHTVIDLFMVKDSVSLIYYRYFIELSRSEQSQDILASSRMHIIKMQNDTHFLENSNSGLNNE